MTTSATIEHLNPEGLVRTPAFTQVVTVTGPSRTILVVDGQSIQPALEVFQRVWGQRSGPPLITVAMVAGPAHPDAPVEPEAVAVVPLDAPG
jgi:hypothetical protein